MVLDFVCGKAAAGYRDETTKIEEAKQPHPPPPRIPLRRAAGAMEPRSPSSTRPPDLGSCDSPPPASQGGSGNGAKVDVARKTKDVDDLLARLEKEGVVLDGKVTSIIDDEIARIKAEAAREAIDESKRNEKMASGVTGFRLALLTAASCAVGFVMGVEWLEKAFRKEFAKRTREIDFLSLLA